MSWPEKQETLDLLGRWLALHEKTEDLLDSIDAVFGTSPESLMFETVWALFGAYAEQIGARIGDSGAPRGESWLDWFCHENDMGRKGMEAGYNGKTKPVHTLEDLHALIVEGREKA